ncbi:unnamed protein product [Ophioblennius macclurei]
MCSVTQCRQAQGELEDAIGAVMKAEQQLRENAREVRSELQSCVSRQQEALRCREVWLLGQIELLEQVKTETLQQQLHQLHRLRGQFDVIVQQLENNNSKDLNNQLTACMEKLASLNLTPEETPDMSFNADTRSLRQAITSFGRITAQVSEGVTPRSPAHKGQSVQSCPMGAQKQKVEGGALSDWLMECSPSQSSAPIGYQSSKNPQDWLMTHKPSQTSCPVLKSVDFLQAWGQLRDLEVWLQQDHAPAGRQRVDSTCSSSFSIEKIDESEFTSSPEEEEEELSDWLITPPTEAKETPSDAERWQRVLKPFQGSWSSSDWLSEAGRPGDCTSCCQSSRPLEIENLGKLKCLKSPPSSGPASPATAIPPATTTAAWALEAWLQQAVPVAQTCKANELCSAYSDCVCEENCGRQALSRWLLQHDGRDKNGVPLTKNAPPTTTTTNAKNNLPVTKNAPPTLFHKEQEQKVQAILEAWLHPTTSSSRTSSSLSAWVAPEEEEEKASREERRSVTSSTLAPFQNPLNLDLWVHPPKRPAPSKEEEEPEEDKWLLKKRSQTQERLALPTVCDLFSCMKVGGDKERWLHRTPVQM